MVRIGPGVVAIMIVRSLGNRRWARYISACEDGPHIKGNLTKRFSPANALYIS